MQRISTLLILGMLAISGPSIAQDAPDNRQVTAMLNDLGAYVGPPSDQLNDQARAALSKILEDDTLLNAAQLSDDQWETLSSLYKKAVRKTRINAPFSFDRVRLVVNDYNNKRTPRMIGDQFVSQIFYGECVDADYGDGRGESDCSNGNVGSAAETVSNFRLNREMSIGFDFWIQPNLQSEPEFYAAERGRFTDDPYHSHLIMFELERIRSIKNHVYDLDVDSRRGVTFLDKTCIKPSEFGRWHRFEMSMYYTDKQDGWIKVSCDGREIYARSNFQSALNPFCYEANGCAPSFVQNFKEQMRMELGAQMRGNGWMSVQEGREPLNYIQPDGIMFRYRNIEIKR